jgi:hypothetical protein
VPLTFTPTRLGTFDCTVELQETSTAASIAQVAVHGESAGAALELAQPLGQLEMCWFPNVENTESRIIDVRNTAPAQADGGGDIFLDDAGITTTGGCHFADLSLRTFSHGVLSPGGTAQFELIASAPSVDTEACQLTATIGGASLVIDVQLAAVILSYVSPDPLRVSFDGGDSVSFVIGNSDPLQATLFTSPSFTLTDGGVIRPAQNWQQLAVPANGGVMIQLDKDAGFGPGVFALRACTSQHLFVVPVDP